jgi:hypothetical protein
MVTDVVDKRGVGEIKHEHESPIKVTPATGAVVIGSVVERLGGGKFSLPNPGVKHQLQRWGCNVSTAAILENLRADNNRHISNMSDAVVGENEDDSDNDSMICVLSIRKARY